MACADQMTKLTEQKVKWIVRNCKLINTVKEINPNGSTSQCHDPNDMSEGTFFDQDCDKSTLDPFLKKQKLFHINYQLNRISHKTKTSPCGYLSLF